MQYEYQATLHGPHEDFPPHLAAGWEFQGWHVIDGETAVGGVRKVFPRAGSLPAVHFSASRNAPSDDRPVKRAYWRRVRA
jgi:hypothetical protein